MAALAWAVPAFVLMVAILMVSTGRRFSAADIGGQAAGPPSEKLAIKAAFLQNTLEQAVIAAGFFFALAAVADGAWLALLPVSAALFVVGKDAVLSRLCARRQGALARHEPHHAAELRRLFRGRVAIPLRRLSLFRSDAFGLHLGRIVVHQRCGDLADLEAVGADLGDRGHLGRGAGQEALARSLPFPPAGSCARPPRCRGAWRDRSRCGG
jgi:hypothetical protein